MSESIKNAIVKNVKCTGCGACNNICPKNAISMCQDENGFYKPIIDDKKCIDCGLCVKVCPTINFVNKHKETYPEAYAIWASDDVRSVSSSGGVFSIVANKILSEGGKVFGAAWDEKLFCYHKGVEKLEDLDQLKFSKYVQSDVRKTYREVKDCILNHQLALFVGCPCQIAGLKSYLGDLSKSNFLYSIDLVCFYAPSIGYFHKYVEENYEIDKVANVNFRDKSKGWNSEGLRIDLKDGTTIFPDAKTDPYVQAFKSGMMRNDICDNCVFADFPRQGDITMGDFWGIDIHDLSWNDNKGTSMVFANSDKGKCLIRELSFSFSRIEKVPFDWCLNKGNRISDNGAKAHPYRHQFQRLMLNHSFAESFHRASLNKHDAGMVVVFNHNFGNNLTNYALYTLLTKLGYSTLIIDLPKNVRFALPKDRPDQYELFINNPFPKYDIVDQCDYKQDLVEYNSMSDIFIVGSDQIWRSMFVEGTEYYTCLEWVQGSKYKMSYGTSFGVGVFENDGGVRKKFEYLIKRFQKVSVREDSGVNLLKNDFKVEATCVLDPVLMCNVNDYNKLADIGTDRIPKNPFVGAYLLDYSDEKANVVHELSEKYKLEKLIIIDAQDYNDGVFEKKQVGLPYPKVEEWLAMIRNCNFFVTDSFHGVCFAIMFHVNFAVVLEKKSWRGIERLNNILGKLDLNDRLISSDSDEKIKSLYEAPINYDVVQEKLDKYRDESLSWLKQALDDANSFVSNGTNLNEVENSFLDHYKSRHELYEYKKSLLAEKIELKDRKDTQMNVIGWGTGGSFRRNIDKVKEYSGMQYVVDSKSNKWNKEIIEGVTCISPETLYGMENVLVIIMVDSTKSAFQIVENLMKHGIVCFDYVENYMEFVESME